MNKAQIIAIVISQGGQLLSNALEGHLMRKINQQKRAIDYEVLYVPQEDYPLISADESRNNDSGIDQSSSMVPAPVATRATAIATGCVPCALGHVGTGSGLINEAVRFAGDDITDPEIILRVNQTLDELNSMERVDLRPEMIVNLPPWERELAEETLKMSRATRHDLEALSSVEELKQVAARLQKHRNDLGIRWYQSKAKERQAAKEETPE